MIDTQLCRSYIYEELFLEGNLTETIRKKLSDRKKLGIGYLNKCDIIEFHNMSVKNTYLSEFCFQKTFVENKKSSTNRFNRILLLSELVSLNRVPAS